MYCTIGIYYICNIIIIMISRIMFIVAGGPRQVGARDRHESGRHASRAGTRIDFTFDFRGGPIIVPGTLALQPS